MNLHLLRFPSSPEGNRRELWKETQCPGPGGLMVPQPCGLPFSHAGDHEPVGSEDDGGVENAVHAAPGTRGAKQALTAAVGESSADNLRAGVASGPSSSLPVDADLLEVMARDIGELHFKVAELKKLVRSARYYIQDCLGDHHRPKRAAGRKGWLLVCEQVMGKEK